VFVNTGGVYEVGDGEEEISESDEGDTDSDIDRGVNRSIGDNERALSEDGLA